MDIFADMSITTGKVSARRNGACPVLQYPGYLQLMSPAGWSEKMIKEKADLLVAALRSGDFKQTTGVLRNGDSFCCLGVACEIYRQNTGQGEWGHNEIFVDHTGDKSFATMPAGVVEWFGAKDFNPNTSIELDGMPGQPLASLNDSGWTFAQIADLIEREWESL